jgi:hypothetical protein
MDAEPVRQRIFNRVIEATSAFSRSGIGVLPTRNSEEPATIAPRRVLVFKASPRLNERINGV